MGKIPDKLRTTIAQNIRNCRMKKFPGRGGGKRCAEAFGVSPQQWSPWERGMRTPDELRLDQIAEFFGVTVTYIREDHSQEQHEPESVTPIESPEPEPHPQNENTPHSVHFRCPFYFPPQPGQPFPGEMRSLCWLAERIFDDLRQFGLPIRLLNDDVDKVLKRYFQYKNPHNDSG